MHATNSDASQCSRMDIAIHGVTAGGAIHFLFGSGTGSSVEAVPSVWPEVTSSDAPATAAAAALLTPFYASPGGRASDYGLLNCMGFRVAALHSGAFIRSPKTRI